MAGILTAIANLQVDINTWFIGSYTMKYTAECNWVTM